METKYPMTAFSIPFTDRKCLYLISFTTRMFIFLRFILIWKKCSLQDSLRFLVETAEGFLCTINLNSSSDDMDS